MKMGQKSPELQSISAKKAEAQRPHHGQAVLDNPNVRELFRDRANVTIKDIEWLKQKGVNELTPFLEVGAGSGQRSAALVNHYSAQGFATDISLNSLCDTPYVLSMLNYASSPLLICCDAHFLPFLPNSFNYIFAYQTFHHFENPVPVFSECYRVLAREGYLFFNEEPMDSSLRRVLRGNRMLTYPPTPFQKIGLKLGVEKLFWDDGGLERSLGMTEARFNLDLWRKALEPFSIIDIEINKKLMIHSDLQKPVSNAFLSGLIGGNVKGLCTKNEGNRAGGDIGERLMCLDCKTNHLVKIDNEQIVCQECKRKYTISNGVMIMLPKQLQMELYP
jgi:SAM-dependent methyltransferase